MLLILILIEMFTGVVFLSLLVVIIALSLLAIYAVVHTASMLFSVRGPVNSINDRDWVNHVDSARYKIRGRMTYS